MTGVSQNHEEIIIHREQNRTEKKKTNHSLSAVFLSRNHLPNLP